MHASSAYQMALGGVLAALAAAIMCLGGFIPVATYVCPMLCSILLWVVLRHTGSRTAWAWYAVVSILSLLFGPDKEAAAVFVFLGYYPILKPRLDRLKAAWLWKLLLFQAAAGAMYALLIFAFGMTGIQDEFRELGLAMFVVFVILGNVTFLLLDRVLGMAQKKWSRKKK